MCVVCDSVRVNVRCVCVCASVCVVCVCVCVSQREILPLNEILNVSGVPVGDPQLGG